MKIFYELEENETSSPILIANAIIKAFMDRMCYSEEFNKSELEETTEHIEVYLKHLKSNQSA